MLKEAQQRMSIFQRRMREQGASLALLTDESSIVDLAGFWGYLGLVGAAPLSAEFCGLPQPASSRSAARAARSPWVVCLRMVPLSLGWFKNRTRILRVTPQEKTVDSPKRSQRKNNLQTSLCVLCTSVVNIFHSASLR